MRKFYQLHDIKEYLLPLLMATRHVCTLQDVTINFRYFFISTIMSVMNWIVSSQNSYVESLTLNVTIFGHGVCREVIGLNEVIRVWPWSNMTGVLVRTGRDTKSVVPSGKAKWEPARRWTFASQRKRLQEEPALLIPWSPTSSLQNCWEIIFCFPSYPVHSILYWQP